MSLICIVTTKVVSTMCFILTVWGRLVIQWTKAAVWLTGKAFHRFSGGCSVDFVQLWDMSTDSFGCLIGRYHRDTLSASQPYCWRSAKHKYLPWWRILPNGHLLKVFSSPPFTVVKLNMTYNCLILEKNFPRQCQPLLLLVISHIKDSSLTHSLFNEKLVRFM